MGTIDYTTPIQSDDSLHIEIPSRAFISDYHGSSCVIYNDKIPCTVTKTGMKAPSDINVTLYLEYFDETAGYLRLEYEESSSTYYTTIVVLSGDAVWKTAKITITCSLNTYYSPGDFRIFCCTTEGTESDLSCILRHVMVKNHDKNAYASWSAIQHNGGDIHVFEEDLFRRYPNTYRFIGSGVIYDYECYGSVIYCNNSVTLPAVSTLTHDCPYITIVPMAQYTSVYPDSTDRIRNGYIIGSDGDNVQSNENYGGLTLVKDSGDGWTVIHGFATWGFVGGK